MKIFPKKTRFKRQIIPFLGRISISTHYFTFACIIILLIAAFSALIGITHYQVYKNNIENESITSAIKIHNILNKIFEDTYRIQLFIGKQIARHEGNLAYIQRVFKDYSEVNTQTNSLYTWSLYNWANADFQQVITTGIMLSEPIDMSDRLYLQNAKSHPWQLWVTESPVIGKTSHQLIIAAGTGVTSQSGHYLGAINIGINISQLSSHLEEKLKSKGINFVLINNNGEIILAYENDLMPKNYLTKNFSSFLKENSAFGFLNKPIKSGNTNYIYYYKIKNYPFYILTGYDIQFANQQFLILVLPRLLEFLGLSLIFLGLLYLFYILFIIPVKQLSFNAQLLLNSNLNKTRKIKINAKEIWYLHKVLLQVKRHITQQIRTSNKIKQINKELIYKKNSLEQSQKELETAINIIVQSNQAKERFIRQVNKDLYTPILTIAQHATHLYQQLKTTQLFKLINTSIEKIYTSSLELKAYSSSSINLEEVNIKNILEEALLINQKTIFDKKIHLQSNIDERLPCLLADDLKLKQACTALIYRSINTTPFQGELYVYCSLSQLKQKHIEIKIFDTGFGLDEAHLESINKKFQKITGWDGLELKLETIKNIIEAHQGEIIINNQIGFGSYTTIFLPYIHKTKINSRNNIYYLNKK